MPERDGYPEGVPAWADLATTDVATAREFYQSIFGWTYTEPDSEDMPYWMAHQKGKAAAGIGPAPDGRSVWNTHFWVDDADETAQKIRNAGGQVVMEPSDILDHGRLAIAADPSGAVFGIWQAGSHRGAAIVNEHGALNWNELTSDDLEAVIPFYEAVFGHRAETTDGANGPYTSLSVGDRAVAGAMPPPVPEIPNHWGLYFAVDDATAATEKAQELGGTLVFGPMDIPDVGIIFGIKDPTGATFNAIELAAPVD